MRSLNKVQLIGRLGKDPEIQKFEDGNMVVKFPMATGESYKDKMGNPVETTDWHNIVVWRKLAEIAGNFLKKGSHIYLEGKLKTRSYDDKDGQKRYVTEIVADNFLMLDSKKDAENPAVRSNNAVQTPIAQNIIEEDTSDLPF